jgi:hypothetical protein
MTICEPRGVVRTLWTTALAGRGADVVSYCQHKDGQAALLSAGDEECRHGDGDDSSYRDAPDGGGQGG